MDVHSLGFNLQHRECGNVHKDMYRPPDEEKVVVDLAVTVHVSQGLMNGRTSIDH